MISENIEMVQIRLGSYQIEVDMDTALKLTTDPVYARDYLQQITNQLNLQMPCNSEDVNEAQTQNDKSPSTIQNKVWAVSKNQTKRDEDATKYFLHLRLKYEKEFADQQTSKNDIWKKIAADMNQMNFFVGEGVEARERCRQKFTNLQIAYFKIIDKMKHTGEGKIEKPYFFDDMNEILGKKHKTNPPLLIDSINFTHSGDSLNEVSELKTRKWQPPLGNKIGKEKPGTSSKENFGEQQPGTSAIRQKCEKSEAGSSKGKESININRFSSDSIKSSVRPKKNDILEKFYLLNKNSEERRQQEFGDIMSHLKDESDKRHEQLLALIGAMSKNGKGSKKRKRELSDDSD